MIKIFLEIINHKLGLFFREQASYKINNNLIIIDATKEQYKKLVCFCSPKLPCQCLSVIPLKKWKSIFYRLRLNF